MVLKNHWPAKVNFGSGFLFGLVVMGFCMSPGFVVQAYKATHCCISSFSHLSCSCFLKHWYGVVAVWNGGVDACFGRGSWPRWSNCADSFRTNVREHWRKRHGELKELMFMKRMIAKCCTQACEMAWPHLQGLVCNNPTYFDELFWCHFRMHHSFF